MFKTNFIQLVENFQEAPTMYWTTCTPYGQDTTDDHFLKRSTAGLNSEISF